MRTISCLLLLALVDGCAKLPPIPFDESSVIRKVSVAGFSCPSTDFELTVQGDGRVVLKGRFYPCDPSGEPIIKEASAEIDAAILRDLYPNFDDAGFSGFKPLYEDRVTDMGSSTLSVSADKFNKTVKGCGNHAPCRSLLGRIEDLVDWREVKAAWEKELGSE